MLPISQLTQSRLSLVLSDKTTNALLNKIPVYAEMSITVELSPYTIHEQIDFRENERLIQNWFVQHSFVLNSINNIIAGNVSENDFNAIGDKHELYITILAELKDNLNDSESEANKQLAITKIVMKALRTFEISINPQPNRQTLHSYPLGTLASDHAGYLSYDLANVISRFKSTVQGTPFVKSDVSFFVYPLAREDLKIDVLQQGRFTPDLIFGKLPIELPEDFDGINSVGLPSMHNPGLEDWYLSPGSFALNPAFFVGADGCENLYPANFATHEFSFFQIVRGTKILMAPIQLSGGLEAITGWSLEYLVSWQPLGHTIGQIVYSLPLAPGEIIKIAVLDWARKSIDSRNEDLTVKEQLVHNTHRDRNISETVDAAMQEWQRGGSFMGGIAGSYGGAGYGISGALGGGYSTSSGNRNIHASTVQQISDSFAQASSSVRELRSTIVIQSDQQEHVKAETRVVANHNHSHALTMLYYEVLRHYKVTTQFSRLRPSLLVQYGHIDFRNINNIVHHRKILESVLIEGRLLACFDAVEKLQCLTTEFDRKKAQAALMPDLNDVNELGEVKLVIKTKQATQRYPHVLIQTKNKEKIRCLMVAPKSKFNPGIDATLPDTVEDDGTGIMLGSISGNPATVNYRQDGQENVFTVRPLRKVLWNDVEGIVIDVHAQEVGSTGGPADPWQIESIQIRAEHGATPWLMHNSAALFSIPVDGEQFFAIQPYKEIPKDPADILSEPERCCIEKLKNHLADNSFHYKKAIWLLEDPNERANRFKEMKITSGEAIIDLIDNRPIDVLGDYVVFPARKFHENSEELDALERVAVEKLMTLPTRGVFAEAKLGHCNASEEIDDTRFWDWQISPIPEQAPGIDNVNVNETKNVTPNLTPTQLPSSIVNIVNPSNLPDPTGMAGAMNLLGKSDIFRDMSVSKEVEDLLEKLADKSVGISEAATKAKEIQQQRESNKASSPGTTPVYQTPPQQRTSPAEAQQEIKVSENQKDKGTITPVEHKENVKTSIGNMNGGGKGSLVMVTIDFKHSISGVLDGEFGVEFIGPVGAAFFTNTSGGVGAGQVTIQTGEQYTIQIKGKRTRLPLSLETIAHIPSVAGDPPFNIDVSNHITKRDVPIEANIVATITKGRKAIHITIVAEEVAKDIKITAKVIGSGTLKANLEGELGLKLEGIDLGHISAGAAVETTVGGELAVEFPVEFKRLTGTVTAPKNELVL
jgi:hypothetical protein